MLDANINRRRVLQGAVWATPAVVIATAVPAAAASGDAASLVISSASAVHNTASLTVNAVVSRSAGVANSKQPVGAVTISFSMPTARVGLLEPSTASAGWKYLSTSVSGANTVFTFQWITGDLTTSNSVTGPLVATLPKGYADNAPFTVTAVANGSSASIPVVSPSVPISVAAGVVAVFGGWMVKDYFAISDLHSGDTARTGVYSFQGRYSPYNDQAAFSGTGVTPSEAAATPGFKTWFVRWRFQILDPNGKVVDEDTGTSTLGIDGSLIVSNRTFTTQAAGMHRGRLIFTSDQVATVKGVNFAMKSFDQTTDPVKID